MASLGVVAILDVVASLDVVANLDVMASLDIRGKVCKYFGPRAQGRMRYFRNTFHVL